MADFSEVYFRQKLDAAAHKVKQILDNTRNPVFASDVPHRYEDKFFLAEMVVKLGLASVVQTLGVLGLTEEQLKALVAWSQSRSVSLRLKAEEKCSFVKEVTRDVDSGSRVETKGGLGGLGVSLTTKVVTKITEYIWRFEGQYEIVAVRGVGSSAEDVQVIKSRKYAQELVSATKHNPRSESNVYPSSDVNITWLVRLLDAKHAVQFSIDREDSKCRTPRRNAQMDGVLEGVSMLISWCWSAEQFFTNSLFPVWRDHGLNVSDGMGSCGVFVPVLPLFDEGGGGERAIAGEGGGEGGDAMVIEGAGSVRLGASTVDALLSEQVRSLRERLAAVEGMFPRPEELKVISCAEGKILVCLRHVRDVCDQLQTCADYVEHMLRKQLVAAVGRELTAADFSAYARFHNRRLFRAEFGPRPFCYAVRRTAQHSPEGHISIEEGVGDGSMSEPIVTIASHAVPGAGAVPMRMEVNAATSVTFGGDRYLHAWLRHSFSGERGAEAFLGAQARQFSSFIMLVGTIKSATEFEAKYGVIVKDKDDFRIPLDVETIPTPKEFRDAIESLSPEQQNFARAFRGMQLASTLFAVLVVQIKPQLERLLRLPSESLTKEIRLTQDLTELFIKYQIPADLLTCGAIVGSGSEDGGARAGDDGRKLEEVKGHVRAMRELIAGSKEKELAEAKETAAHSVFGSVADRGMLPFPAAGGGGDPMFCFGSMPASSPYSELSLASCAAPMMAAPTMICCAPPLPPPAPIMAAARKMAAVPAQAQRRGPPPPPAPRPEWGGSSAQNSSAPSSSMDQHAGKASQLAGELSEEAASVDYTRLPAEMDRKFEKLDVGNALRPTILKAGEAWTLRAQPSLLAPPAAPRTLRAEEQRSERGRALDLIDALTRSGALSLEDATLHVVLAATHGFDKGLVDTVVQVGRLKRGIFSTFLQRVISCLNQS
mmetsp:Transcript_37829/g.100542  ORF Transcript_37829/g.100542 Transcript_37829/m.100542 type:complete len:938 (+) Transcript_37829:111-2924(+)